jgi:mannose/fructose/N-acetylgalactosamine-specific phosphotransferase system component IIC
MIMTMIFGVVLGAVMWMDRVFMFQFMVSRPMIMAPLIGFVMGDIRAGLLIGASLELLWLNAPPVGSYLPNDESFCVAVAVPVAIFATGSMNVSAAAGYSILLSMPFSLAGRSMDMHLRTLNERLIPPGCERGEKEVRSAMRKALARAFLYALVSIGVCTAILVTATSFVKGYIPEFVLTSFSYMPFMCIVIGLATLVSKDIPRRAHSGMFVLGMALALVLAWIL